MSNTPYPQSYYAASANPAPERPALQGEVETDVCVIGAGYTGLSSALFLLEAGFKVTVLEAAKVGFGASGRNGGQIVNSYSRDIDVIERTVGAKQAQLLGQMAFEGGKIIRERVAKYQIQCDLKDGGVFAAITAKQMGHLEAQKKLWERFGNTSLELLDQRRIREVVACDQYQGGLLDMSGGHIHPLNLALGEAAAVESLGGTIYEQSPAVRIERGANPVVHTPQGKVRAKFIIVAGNAYLGNLVPELASKSMPCGTQVITTEPLGDELANTLLPQDYCVEDCNYLLDYYRLSGDKRLIFGGGVVYGRPERETLAVGDLIDGWKVITIKPLRQLAMMFGMKAPGLGRLTFTIKDLGGCRSIDVRAWWHPAGFSGLLYWFVMMPAHLFIFRGMAKRIAALAEQYDRERTEPAQNESEP